MVTSFTYFARLTDAQGKRVHTSWPKLLERLSVARVVADKHDAPGISLATYRGDRRAKANVEHVFAVGIDLDHLDALSVDTKHEGDVDAFDWPALAHFFAATDSLVHTTWSSRDDALRARAFLRLGRPCTAEEYERVFEACARYCESFGLVVDRAARDPSRLWFLPSVPPGGVFRFARGEGRPVNVEGALRSVPPPPPPPRLVVPPAPAGRIGDVEARAAAYVEAFEPAISGSGGHTTTFRLAMRLVQGFALDEATAYRLMSSWNARCQPPWKEWELRRKVKQAAERGQMATGQLRDAERRSA